MLFRADRAPMFVVLAFVAAPLAWAACTEPPPAAKPASSPLPARAPDGVGASEPARLAASEPAPLATSEDPPQATSGEPAPTAPKDVTSAIAAIPRFKAGARLSPTSCERLLEQASQARFAAMDNATDCSVNSDCQDLDDGFCGFPYCAIAVAKTAAPTYRAELARIEKVACPAWSGGGCAQTYPLPMPSCARPAPFCKHGHCSMY
jgi:hypothetical protein